MRKERNLLPPEYEEEKEPIKMHCDYCDELIFEGDSYITDTNGGAGCYCTIECLLANLEVEKKILK